jgi:hypothetical protein
MKVTSTLFKILLSLLFILNICLLWFVNTGSKEIFKLNQLLNTSNDSIMNLNIRMNNIFLNFSIMFDYQSFNIDSNTVLLDESDNIVFLKQLVDKKPKLIFKYSTLNCNVCVDEQISLLKEASKKIGSENIIILANYNSPKELSQFARMNQINFKVFNLRNVEFTAIDKGLPYYFILDESISLKLLFIPIKGDTFLTQKYFDKISGRYFQ